MRPTRAPSVPSLPLLLLTAAAAVAGITCTPLATNFDCQGNGCDPVCKMPGEACTDTGNCCAGMACATDTNTCCSLLAEPCTSKAGCCAGLDCQGGVCACLPEGGSCAGTDVKCCDGLSCDATGHCRAACPGPVGACQPYGGACTGNGDCCASATCLDGTCLDPSMLLTCATEGRACATTADCCGAAVYGSQLDCVFGADGGGTCHLGRPGEACDSQRHCLPGSTCVVDAGVAMDAGTSDAGFDDGGTIDDGGALFDGGAADAGVDDGGVGDAGIDDGGVGDGGTPPEPQGVCTLPSTGATCTLYSATCGLGDFCNPNSSTNQGYDPCGARVVSGYLRARTPPLACEANHCRLPAVFEACSTTCQQTPGDPRRTVCAAAYDTSKMCLPACSTDDDCRTASTYDTNLNSPQPVSNLCQRYGNSFSVCQPALCYIDGQAGYDDPAVLYKPCVDHPGTVCLPRFSGVASTVLGFCMVARTGPTVGEVCDPRAGREATAATCGADAVCLGGRCAAACDASQLGGAGTPTCSPDKTCISAQGVDLVAAYQVGGCGDPCDPFADFEHSGCVNACGGPPARCDWIIGDPVVGQPRGYCGAAVKVPLKTGDRCTRDPLDPCEAGDFCLRATDGFRYCTKLCDPTAAAGTPDACPSGQTCNAFDPLKRSGYCQ